MKTTLTTAAPTMSSREVAELIASGGASPGQALDFAARVVAGISRAVRAVSAACCDDGIPREKAKEIPDNLSTQIVLARNISCCLERYPSAKDLLTSALTLSIYAEATLTPCVLLTRNEGRGDETKTYIIQNPDSDLIKIGKSIDVAARIKALETGASRSLEILCVIDRDIERDLHARFSDLRVFGEWFRDDGSIARYVKEANA